VGSADHRHTGNGETDAEAATIHGHEVGHADGRHPELNRSANQQENLQGITVTAGHPAVNRAA
jgi:predicted Zn-dependent protease